MESFIVWSIMALLFIITAPSAKAARRTVAVYVILSAALAAMGAFNG